MRSRFSAVNPAEASYLLCTEDTGAISSAFLQVCIHLDDGGTMAFLNQAFPTLTIPFSSPLIYRLSTSFESYAAAVTPFLKEYFTTR